MPRPPLNVVWLVSDHQALANRPPAARRLPLQARLAHEGMRFERAYTPLPVCTPARASMLTGLYPHAHGLTENEGRFGGRAGLDPGEWLVHRPFADAGYRCGWFGKWHLDQERSAAGYGFAGFSLPGYGYPYATAAYRDYLADRGLPDPTVTVELGGESGIGSGERVELSRRDAWYDYESGTAWLDGPADVHEAFFVSRLAQAWLAEAAGHGPFFLRVDPWGPHPPYTVTREIADDWQDAGEALSGNVAHPLTGRPDHHADYRDYWQRTLGLDRAGWRLMAGRALQHAAMVETALLEVVDAVDAAGLARDTLIVFCADHGDAVGSNGGVANKGGLMVEETMRIPLLVRGPGIAPGSRSRELVSSLDLPSTLLECAGLEPRSPMHGCSLAPLLRGDGGLERRGLLAQHYGLHVPVVQRAYYEGNWKLVVQADGFEELYRLDDDPCELANLAGDPGSGEQRHRLRLGLREAMAAVGDRGDHLGAIA